MSRQDEQEREPRERRDEDTEAILQRRRFLIQSALAGLGLSAALAACDRQPTVCLTPEPCLEVAPPKTQTPPTPDTKAGPKPDTKAEPKPKTEAGPQPCLSLPLPEPRPCLEVPPPEPKPCLKPVPPKRDPDARPCLSMRRDR